MKLVWVLSVAVLTSLALAAGQKKDDKVPSPGQKAFVSDEYWDLDSIGSGNQANTGDWFGYALASGDFNGDQWGDLAVGIPRADFTFFGTFVDAGLVMVIYGSANGLDIAGRSYLRQSLVDDDGLEAGDFFGWSLASGDFNGDDIDDLAVGSPFEDVTYNPNQPVFTTRDQAGAVSIFLGSVGGFEPNQASTYVHQGRGGNNFDSAITPSDHFGWSLVADDFDNDGFDDLAVGVPDEDLGATDNAGQVDIYFGGDPNTGILLDDKQSIAQSSPGIIDDPEAGDQFGFSLASGNLNSSPSGFPDLVIGVPGESVNGNNGAGAVQVIYGTMTGLGNTNQLWSQAGDIAGVEEDFDQFGYSVAVGRIDSDSYDDLVVGSPGEDLNADGVTNAGAINVIYGSLSVGLTTAGNQLFHENNGLIGSADDGDRLGEALSVGDINADGFADIVLGIPTDTLGTTLLRGSARIIFGASSGATATGNEIYSGDSSGSEFGRAVLVADFGAGNEMAVGAPHATSVAGTSDSGSSRVFRFAEPLNPPIFTAVGPFSVIENSANSTLVGDLNAINGNGGSIDVGVSYSIDTGNVGGVFAIDSASGQLSVADSSLLDFESQQSYQLSVIVADNQMLTDIADVTIDVSNVNDEAPLVTANGPFFVPEFSPNDAFVGSVYAVDGDGGGINQGLTFSITAGNGAGAFAFLAAPPRGASKALGNPGVLLVNNSALLDASVTPTWNLSVQIDDGLFQTDTIVVINVTDILFSDSFEAAGP